MEAVLTWLAQNVVGLIGATAGIFAYLAWDSTRRVVTIDGVYVEPNLSGNGPHLLVRLRASRSEVYLRSVALLQRRGEGIKPSAIIAGSSMGRLEQGDMQTVAFPWLAVHQLHSVRVRGGVRCVCWFDADGTANRTAFGELWVGLAEGPAFDDYASGSGQYAEQALRRLSDRLRERRGVQSGA